MTRTRNIALLVLMLVAALPLIAADPASEIEVLETTVQSLGVQQLLTPGQVRSLVVKLEHANDALRQADARKAMTQLHAFESEARGVVRASKLDPKIGAALLAGAISARLAIDRIAHTVPPIRTDVFQPCGSPQACMKTPMWVNSRARKGGTGSESSPVATIAEAISLARAAGACGIELHLSPGIYPESIDVPLDLEIAGNDEGVVIEGSIVNRGGWSLDIDRITLRSSPWPGAIVVDSACASSTEISRATIEGATGAGIAQRGGSIRLGLSIVRGTLPVPGEPGSGTGVKLTGGAKAVLGLVALEENRGGGLLAMGTETEVYAGAVVVARNEITPHLEPLPPGDVPQAPGIDVRDGALLLMQFGVVRENQLYGLMVREGSRAHIRFTRVERTMSLPEFHPYHWAADSNVVVVRSRIELASVTLSRALVGLLMLDSLGAGTRGEISHHEIGLAVSWSGPPIDETYNLVRCLTDRTPFINNVRNIDASTLPLPPPDLPGEEPPPAPPCARVPFDCTWCG